MKITAKCAIFKKRKNLSTLRIAVVRKQTIKNLKEVAVILAAYAKPSRLIWECYNAIVINGGKNDTI